VAVVVRNAFSRHTVILLVECVQQMPVDAQGSAHLIPKLTWKLVTMISDHTVEDPMVADNFLEEHSWQLWRVNTFPVGQIDHHVSQSVNDIQDPSLP
jgi:hypothetical protein